MNLLRKLLWVCAAALTVVVLVWGALLAFGPAVLPFLLVLGLAYGWMLGAYLQYRHGRQDEFLQLLAAAAESGAPLTPALEAYLRDRPQGGWREFWVAVLLFFVLPGYYWVWHRRHSYDRKVARVARLLADGVPLHQALRDTPGVASPATVLAAAVGAATGQLGLCLRRSAQGGLAPVWLEALPRLLYPPALLVFAALIGEFWMTFLAPRMERIFRDFNVPLPPLTEQLIGAGNLLADYGWVVGLAVAGAAALAALVCFSQTARWFCPGLGRIYRLSVQSRVLKMLAVLLEAQRPVPEALALLAGAEGVPGVVRRRLDAAGLAVTLAEPLADGLRRGDLLPRSAVPLVRAAERARNLPWALAELGDLLAARAARLARRLSLALFPAAVVAVGLLIGLMVLGMFLPLVELITELAS